MIWETFGLGNKTPISHALFVKSLLTSVTDQALFQSIIAHAPRDQQRIVFTGYSKELCLRQTFASPNAKFNNKTSFLAVPECAKQFATRCYTVVVPCRLISCICISFFFRGVARVSNLSYCRSHRNNKRFVPKFNWNSMGCRLTEDLAREHDCRKTTKAKCKWYV